MRTLHLIPVDTKIQFIPWRKVFFAASTLLVLCSIGLFTAKGMNYGIDFTGGILIEVRTQQKADIAGMRSTLSNLDLGSVDLQTFGAPNDVLIRVQTQPGGDKAQQPAVEKVKDALGPGIEYRRVETVGPKVSEELFWDGIYAVGAAMLAILVYIWFRFEWQFGLGAVIALIHDVLSTIGIFSLLGLEFNLSTVAAVLTIAGYSINDTVVVFDRVRENLRRYKSMTLPELLNVSINETLSRTVMTSLTTLLALFALYFLGGEVISGFSFAMIWGVLVGTYSSVCVAVPLLLYLNVRRPRGAAARTRRRRRSPPHRPIPGLDITPSVPAGSQVINAYGGGQFRVGGAVHEGSVLVWPDRCQAWPAQDASHVTLDSLAPLFAGGGAAAAILLVGCGPRFVLEPAGLRADLRGRGVVLEWMDTGAACRTFNVLLTEGRDVAAALLAVE